MSEDDAHLRDTFRRFLSKDGYLVDTAGEYQAAVRLAEISLCFSLQADS